ncbi:MAG TPA: cation-translocating P-type ATPase [bacterium]|nr:cation-translocating P-type ATPase [bacterium]
MAMPNPRPEAPTDLRTITVRVPAMDCPEEVRLIESAWAPLEGVLEVRTHLLERTATALVDPSRTAPEALLQALGQVGLQASLADPGRPADLHFHVPALDDGGTLAAITGALADHQGAGAAQVDLDQRTLTVPFDPTLTSPTGVHQALLATGVVVQAVEAGPSKPLRQVDEAEETAEVEAGELLPSGYVPPPEPTGGTFVAPPDTEPAQPAPFQLDDRLLVLGTGLVLWIVGALLYRLPSLVPQAIGQLFLLLVVLGMGYQSFLRAINAVRRRRIDMHVLMTIATLGALVIGEWIEGAMLMWLFALALWVEGWNLDRAKRAVQALSVRQPSRVRVLVDGSWDQLPLERVRPGARVLVRPGELVPLDGVVVSGDAAVDEASVTGEPIPVAKEPGSPVLAGTLCTNGMLEYVATRPASESTVQRLRALVLEAQGGRAPLQSTVDRFAAKYTPILLMVAVTIALIPPAWWHLFHQTASPTVKNAVWHQWLYRGLAVLVVACPCALVISTPVAFIAALARGARQGILIKGGRVLEALAQLRALAFDKTGTLTRGTPELAQLVALGGITETDLARLALTLEAHATHPLAIAVARYAGAHGLTPLEGLVGFRQVGGKGVEGWLGQTPFALGSMAFLIERGVRLDPPVLVLLREAEGWGATLVGVAAQGRLVGLLAFTDPPRPEARQVLATLRRRGIERLELLTGDNQAVAAKLAADLPLDAIHANLLPEDKQTELKRLQQSHRYVGMVGDGLNDAPALASATVGIAMGERGADVAMETADVVLVGEDLGKVTAVVDLARATVRTIQQNIAIALVLKGAVLIAIALGWAGLWQAILGDMGASLLVTANSLRLLRK